MRAYYGFKDGSGDWFICIDTDQCTGCGACVEVCPAHALEVGENEYDPMSEALVAGVKDAMRKKIRYACAPCQPGYGEKPAPCVAVCEPEAISHSEAWRQSYGEK